VPKGERGIGNVGLAKGLDATTPRRARELLFGKLGSMEHWNMEHGPLLGSVVRSFCLRADRRGDLPVGAEVVVTLLLGVLAPFAMRFLGPASCMV
jgi:hypothetical protein